MSKIQSSIQKAISKSKQPNSRPKRVERRTKQREEHGEDGSVASGIFRIFKIIMPDTDTMEANRIVSAGDDRRAQSAYKILRTRVLQRMRANNWRTLIVTSAGPGEGKTLTSSNLAMGLARDVNQSVMLVDFDLQRSSVARTLGIDVDVKAGTGDYLMGNAEIEDIIYAPAGMQRIAVLPNREPIPNSSELLASPRAKRLIERLRTQSESSIVVFDMPPVLGCDDVLAFMPSVDAVLLVVAQGQTDRPALEKTIQLLGETNVIGIVLNKSNEHKGSEPYGYY